MIGRDRSGAIRALTKKEAVFRASSYAQLSSEGLFGLLDKLGSQLKELDLRGMDVPVKDWTAIALKTPNLKKLNVSGTTWDAYSANGAFRELWACLEEVVACNCEGLFGRIHEWAVVTEGVIKRLDIRGAKGQPFNAEKLIDALPTGMTGLLLGEVEGSLQGLKEKMPSEELDLSGSTQVTLDDLQPAIDGQVKRLHVSGCKNLKGSFFSQLSYQGLRSLSVADTLITDKLLASLPLAQLEEVDLSHCSKLTGKGIGKLQFGNLSILRLAGLDCLNDENLPSVDLPKRMKFLSLERSAVTMKGVVALLRRCQPAQLIMPTPDRWEMTQGIRWTEKDIDALLCHLRPSIEVFVVEGCPTFLLTHLQEVISLVPGLKEITLRDLKIGKSSAVEVIDKLEKLRFKVIDLVDASDGEEQKLAEAIANFYGAIPKLWAPAVKVFEEKLEISDEAKYYYGMAFYEGRGVEKNERRGYDLVQDAAFNGSLLALIQYGKWKCEEGLKRNTPRVEDVVHWLEEKALEKCPVTDKVIRPEVLYWAAFYRLEVDSNDKKGREHLGQACTYKHEEAHALWRKLNKHNSSLSLVTLGRNSKGKVKRAFDTIKSLRRSSKGEKK
jgi:hypothetical protein